MARGELLLEVRAEEIPARMLPGAIRELGTRVFEELMARGLAPREVETAFTPRRLVLTMNGVPAKEPDREELLLGPPVKAAFRPDGAVTPALDGFAKKGGADVSDLLLVEGQKGKIGRTVRALGDLAQRPIDLQSEGGLYLAANRQIVGRATVDVLAELLPRLLGALTWAKTMRWGSGVGPWVRPIQGIVALFENQVVPFSLFGVAAGRVTTGHPVLSPKPFTVRGVADYRTKLARRGLVIAAEARREALARGMRARASALGGQVVDDPELLDKLAAICEIPGVLEGSFDAGLLELPREVLTTSLRDHQSAFSAETASGLLPVFLTVMDRPDDPIGRVRAGNEWVVAARLADARFFYRKDRATPLAARHERLAHLAFHDKLGSYLAKTERLEKVSALLCDELGWSAERADAIAAAQLLKVDLTCEMVREFTSLQGVMGGIYAREEGLPEPIWQALYDQYRPAAAEDPIPRGRVGLVTALADRIDTLVGFFGLGLIPSGSRDPFGLRRAAQGVVRILLEGDVELDLRRVLSRAQALYGASLPATAGEQLAPLTAFFEERIRHLLGVTGYAYDEIEAGLGAGWHSLPELRRRVAALHETRDEPGFLQVVLAAKRIANITRGVEDAPLDPRRLAPGAEADLAAACETLRAGVDADLAAGDYARSLRRIAELAAVLDRFFVEVLVMDPDPAVRANRIALLRQVAAELARVAALTEMVVDKSELREKASA